MSITYPSLSNTTFPDTIQVFTTFLNITPSDAVLIQRYQAAVQEGRMEDAQNIFASIQNGNQKIIDATKLNTLMDTALALENFFKTDIKPYIDVKQGEWQNIINLFNYKGTYSPVETYVKNNFVNFVLDGVNYVFIATANPPVGADPSNTAYWRNLSVRGEKGDSGVGLAFLYQWDSTVNYSVDNVVTYGNYVWGATQNNRNQAPSEGSAYWKSLGTIKPREIPVTASYPALQETGDIWFRVLDDGGGYLEDIS